MISLGGVGAVAVPAAPPRAPVRHILVLLTRDVTQICGGQVTAITLDPREESPRVLNDWSLYRLARLAGVNRDKLAKAGDRRRGFSDAS